MSRRATLEVCGDDRRARFDDARWVTEVRVLDVDESSGERRTRDDSESLLLVLSGTHDLLAGAGSWLRRGLREAPWGGRPVGVFLPPATTYRTSGGSGRLLVLSARQPAPPTAPSGRDALAQKPLLQLAGSGKAFDPATGSWKPQEAFLSSPEAILPRRIERVPLADGVVVERILGPADKPLGLCVDEVAVDGPAELQLPPPIAAAYRPAEAVLYLQTEGRAAAADGTWAVERGDAVVFAADGRCPEILVEGGPCYVAVAWVGPKPAAPAAGATGD